MGVLAAFVAEGPGKRRAAVEALRFVRVPVAFAGLRFDRAAKHAAGHRITQSFEFAHLHPTSTLCGLRRSC
jgi:hypothetical protein